MKNRVSSVVFCVALAVAGAFAMAADAATGPTAVPRGRVPIKGDFGETVTVRADALDDLSTGGTDDAGNPIGIAAKYLKLLTRNGAELTGEDWKESAGLQSADFTALLKVVNDQGVEAVSMPFTISVMPIFVDVTEPSKKDVNVITSEGYWRMGVTGMFDNVIPRQTAESVGSLGTIADKPAVIYKFLTSTPIVTCYSIRAFNRAFHASASPKRAPKAWEFAGSNDGSTWTLLDARSGQTGWSDADDGEIRYFGFANATAYASYRLKFLEDNGDIEVGISEVEFYTEPNAMLVVAGSPSQYCTPSPVYGLTFGHALGEPMEFSVASCLSSDPEDGVRSATISKGKRVLSLGYELGNCNGLSTVAEEALSGYAFLGVTRVTWLWQEQYRIGAQSNDETGGSVVIDDGTAAASCFVWKNAGASTDVRAVPAPGYVFSTWSGDLAEGQKKSAEITLTHDKKRDLTAVFVSSVHIPTTITWTGKGTGTGGGGQVKAWDDPANWDLNTTPGEGDTVIISQNSQMYVTISAPPPHLKKLSVSGAVELRLSGWNTKIDAETVEFGGATVVCPADSVRVGAADTNRVWIVCTDLTVGAKASINANEKGFDLNGPGCPTQCNDGASHGGRGGAGAGNGAAAKVYNGGAARGTACIYGDPRYLGGAEYDSLACPELPGSGGYCPDSAGIHLRGGGVIRVQASGCVRIDGTITANGAAAWSTGRGGSSGGSVYISAATVDGTGTVSAKGGKPQGGAGGGGGGRVSITWSDAAGQRALSPSLTFDLGGLSDVRHSTASSYPGEPGTLYLTDDSFFPGAVCAGGGRVYFAEPHHLVFDDLTVKGSALEFADGSTFEIRGDLILVDGGELRVHGKDLAIGGDLVVDGRVEGASQKVSALALIGKAKLTVGGSVTLADKGELWTQCGITNAPNDWGMDIDVAGDFTIAAGGVCFPESHPTSLATGATRLRARTFTVAAGGEVDGVAAGWQTDGGTGSAHARGHGVGGSMKLPGASHAGLGGRADGKLLAEDKTNGGPCYGRARLPLTPGSASGSNNGTQWVGVPGGGQLAVYARKSVTIDGAVSVAGQSNAGSTCCGGGSGGSFYVETPVLLGAGSISAAGGNAGGPYVKHGGSNLGNGGGGGGGYITIRADASGFTGTHDVSGGKGYYDESTGEDHRGCEGRYRLMPPKGGMKLILR